MKEEVGKAFISQQGNSVWTLMHHFQEISDDRASYTTGLRQAGGEGE